VGAKAPGLYSTLRGAQAPLFHGGGWETRGSASVNTEIEVDLGAIVELADGLGLALMTFVLGVDLVVNGVGECGEAVAAILADDVGFYGAGARIGQINDGVGNGIVMRVEDFAKQQAAGRLVLIRCGMGRGSEDSE
jgi:hypothetical protein